MTGFLIAGTSSGLGKTSITIGLSQYLQNNLHLHKHSLTKIAKEPFTNTIQTFKTGPDFLDTTWLSLASERQSYNLDTWMTNAEYCKKIYETKAMEADISIVEGAMGLFCGSLEKSKNTKKQLQQKSSSAQIAKLLDLPILLIVNASGQAQSFAATVHGFHSFTKGIKFLGIIANFCGSSSHAQILAKQLEEHKLPPLIGYFLKEQLPPLQKRHLGVHSAYEDKKQNLKTINELSSIIQEQINWKIFFARLELLGKRKSQNKILAKIARLNTNDKSTDKKVAFLSKKQELIKMGIAYDDAFYFYYKDNLDLFEEYGFEIIPFSPLQDSRLPANIDFLYIGGGYPELYASELSRNQELIKDIRSFVHEKCKKIYAECGGLSYLSQGIYTETSNHHKDFFDLVGLLPFETQMTPKFKRLGYIRTTIKEDCLLAQKGAQFRGHAFHYSEIKDDENVQCDKVFLIRGTREQKDRLEGYCVNGVLASYVHQHFASNLNSIENIKRYCKNN